MEAYYIVMDYPDSPMFFYHGDWIFKENDIKLFSEQEVLKHMSYLMTKIKEFRDGTCIYVTNKSQARMWFRIYIDRN